MIEPEVKKEMLMGTPPGQLRTGLFFVNEFQDAESLSSLLYHLITAAGFFSSIYHICIFRWVETVIEGHIHV